MEDDAWYGQLMKVAVWLAHELAVFRVQDEQLQALRARHPQHSFEAVETEAEFLPLLATAEAALVWRFSSSWYALGPKLRFVATPAAGREQLRPDERGRVRAVHGHFHGKIMAESLLAMVLFFARRLDTCVDNQQAHRYERAPYATTRRLVGQQALIVGYGSVGRECARLLQAVGMSVVGVKRQPNADLGPATAVHPLERLSTLLPEADHVILTVPGDTSIGHLISDAELALMRPTACLYNLGRGNALDEAAVIRALTAGKLGHAFLDVFEREPLPPDSPLWETPNLAILPHASAFAVDYLNLWFEELGAELVGS